jgi:hypothetical protein
MKAWVVVFLASFFTGCCMKSVEVTPYATALDVTAAKVGAGGIKTQFDFSQCCPSGNQQAIAEKLQEKMALGFQKLVDQQSVSEDELDRYNKKVDVAHAALTKVVLLCQAQVSDQAKQAVERHIRDEVIFEREKARDKREGFTENADGPGGQVTQAGEDRAVAEAMSFENAWRRVGQAAELFN